MKISFSLFTPFQLIVSTQQVKEQIITRDWEREGDDNRLFRIMGKDQDSLYLLKSGELTRIVDYTTGHAERIILSKKDLLNVIFNTNRIPYFHISILFEIKYK